MPRPVHKEFARSAGVATGQRGNLTSPICQGMPRNQAFCGGPGKVKGHLLGEGFWEVGEFQGFKQGRAHEKTCHWPLPPMLPQEEPSNANLKKV